LFLSLCGLMSTGARTILISRWRTGGQTSLGLVREFAQELPHISPAEAWQRSVQVAINTQIDPAHEPRLKKAPPGTELPNADHPFFWAGYMLVDSGVKPEGQDNALGKPAAGGAQPANPPLAPPAAQPVVDNPAPVDMSDKPARKSKSPPRSPTKKPTPRQKPAAPAQDD
jgi:hypothetical protein